VQALDVATLIFCVLAVIALLLSIVTRIRIYQLRARHRQLLCMQLLEHHPEGQYGLEIISASDGLLHRGHVYVVLGKLAAMGCVEQLTDTHGRPFYRLTDHGASMLRWIYAQAKTAEKAP
jgi:DNA-binding PadR family transcriptional regulator